MEISKNLLKGIGIAALSGMMFTSCGDDTPDVDGEVSPIDSTKTVEIPKPKDGPVKFDNNIFSIPSPIQLSGIIQKTGSAYDQDMLNDPSKVDQYSNLTAQALNLGIYGADLGYATLYDKTQESIKYMRAAQKLSSEVGIIEAFDQATVSSIERNLENKDSLLYIVSNSYRKADDYLQVNDRKHIGALIIVGGWIESLYFAGKLGVANKNQDVINLIGLQKHTLETMMDKMLINYLNEPDVQGLYDQLEEVRTIFENGVEIKSEYVAPEVDKENKITTIKNKTTVTISEETFKAIVDKIEAIRNSIIQ